MAVAPLVGECLRCPSTVVVAITYISVNGHPVQAGLCETHIGGTPYVDRLPKKDTKEDDLAYS